MNQAPAMKPSVKPAQQQDESETDFKEMDNDYFELMQESAELDELNRRSRHQVRRVHWNLL